MVKKDGRFRREDREYSRYVAKNISRKVKEKYERGCREHGGGLYDKPVINFIGDEITDLICYFQVIRDQWLEMINIIGCANIDASKVSKDEKGEVYNEALTKINNILTLGNPIGVRRNGD